MNAKTLKELSVDKRSFKNTISLILGYKVQRFIFVMKPSGVSAICRYKGWKYASKQEDIIAALHGLKERIRYDEYMKQKSIFNKIC